MKIACVQFAPTYRDLKKSLDRISEFVHRADADLIIFPELALTGYFFTSPDEIASLAERIDGPIALALGEIAKRENKAIITGFLEEGTGLTPTPLPAGRGANTLLPAGRRGQGDEVGVQFYNAALAFDNAGKLAGHYRKVHLFYFETQIFSRGDLGFPVFPLQTRSGTAQVGMLICYDWRFPEAAHALALKGAELIAMPSN